MKRIIAMTMACCLMLAVFAACNNGGSGGGSGKLVTITFPTMWVGVNSSARWAQPAIEDFNKQFEGKIKVEIEEIPGDQAYVDKLKVLYSSKSLPDVMNAGGYNLIDLMLDQLTDITSYVDADWKKDISPQGYDFNSRNGKLYGIPYTRNVIGYFYNKDLFAQAGISAPAKTWDELFDQAEKLKAAGITPFAMDTADSGWLTSLWLGAMIGSSDSGNKFMNTLLPKDYNTPEFIDAATKVQKMFTEYTTKDAVGGAYEHGANNFLSGKVAMIANGPWMVGDFYDTSIAPEGFPDSVAAAIYPGDVMYSGGKYGYHVGSKSDEKTKAAMEFIKFMVGPNVQKSFFEDTGDVPDAVSFKVADDARPLLKETVANSNASKYKINDYQALWWPNTIDEISQLYPLLAQGKMTPEEFAKKMTEAAAKN